MTTALYRRYRPDSFAQVIGQEHVTDPLRAALRANKVTHAYLFSGPRGCGKTTSARILARCLNCVQGPTDTPCGECDSCRELATGGPGSLDVVEIDAASHGGVDDARELRERATFAPVRDRYKVFIIDEAHMVTPQGFNALLKLVEEPPEHVKFVFATTEPDRVLGTIRSRTHHYPFRLVPPDALEPYLGQLSHEEGIKVAPGVLSLVIRAGGGSVRDTLSVLDQLMAGTIDGTLGYHQAVALLGYTDSALLDETVDALAGGDGAAVYRVVERMVESGHDPRRFVEDLLQRLRDLLIISVAGDGAADVLTGTPADQLERMVTQARNWGSRHLSRAADLTDQALRAMVGATSPRLQLELLIGRILVPAVSQEKPAEGALPGTVGMAGGGAPHEAHVQAGSEAEGGARRFGAAQAREELRRKRQSEAGASEFARAPEETSATASTPGTYPTSAPATAPAPSAALTTPAKSAARPQDATSSGYRPAFSSEPASAPTTGGWTDVTAAVPGGGMSQASAPTGYDAEHTPGQASSQTGAASTPTPTLSLAPTSISTPPPESKATSGAGRVAPPASLSRDADMLRQRWPEVVERLSSISRVAWSLLRGNGQLGGVDGTTAVVLLPTEGMVDTFMRGNRAADVERAIHEATGLSLTVIAQVGQASGGAQVTTPTAAAAPAQSSAPVIHEEDSAPADPFRVEPERAQASAPAEVQEEHLSAEAQVAEDGGWPTPAMPASPPPQTASEDEAAPEPEGFLAHDNSVVEQDAPRQMGWPEPVMPPNFAEERGMPASSAGSRSDSFASDPFASDPFASKSPETDPFGSDPFEAPAPQALAAWSEPVAVIPNAIEPQDTPAAPEPYASPAAQQAGASSVFGDEVYGDTATGKTSANLGHAQSAGFTRPRFTQVEGSGADPAGSIASPVGATSTSPSIPTSSADPEPTVSLAYPQVSAAEDDSASIDDVNVENSQSYGLPAVLEILGGKVIEEIRTEGGW